MCGVVGGVSERNVVKVILEGLSRLEYRGYDSVGVAVVDRNGQLARERVTGRVKMLAEKCSKDKFKGLVGIGHTRWATHGGVTESNAHPHFSNETLAVVHNGIIENYAELRSELQAQGYHFESQTDTEVIVHVKSLSAPALAPGAAVSGVNTATSDAVHPLIGLVTVTV